MLRGKLQDCVLPTTCITLYMLVTVLIEYMHPCNSWFIHRSTKRWAIRAPVNTYEADSHEYCWTYTRPPLKASMYEQPGATLTFDASAYV